MSGRVAETAQAAAKPSMTTLDQRNGVRNTPIRIMPRLARDQRTDAKGRHVADRAWQVRDPSRHHDHPVNSYAH
jgi:hypothetical protein